MFCKNCGKELNEGTKFCNHCGALQEEATPQSTIANNTPPTPATNKNSPLKLVIIAAVAVVCFAIGSFVIAPALSNDTSGDNDSTTSQTNNTNGINNTQNNSVENDTQNNSVENNTQNNSVENDTQNNRVENNTQNNNVDVNNGLKELTYNKNKVSGSVWKSALGSKLGSMTVSAGYCTENDLIYDITFSIELKKEFEYYDSFKTTLEYFEKQIKAANDDEMVVDFDVTEDGLEFFASFDGLEYANRSERVSMASEVIGVAANTEDVAFYYSDVDTELKSLGFN